MYKAGFTRFIIIGGWQPKTLGARQAELLSVYRNAIKWAMVSRGSRAGDSGSCP